MNKADKFTQPIEDVEVTYPMYEPGKLGIRVRVSRGMYIPGEFMGQLLAERAYAKYLGKQATATAKRRKSNKKEAA